MLAIVLAEGISHSSMLDMTKDIVAEMGDSEVPRQLLIAAAGAGKTRVLTNVLAWRIESGRTKPLIDRVVVFTFTKNAADELLFRLTKLLPNASNLLNSIYIGTIHGWCNEWLRSEGQLSNTKVVDELERLQLLMRIYAQLGLDGLYAGNSKFARVSQFAKDIDLLQNEGLEVSDPLVPEKLRGAFTRYLSFMESQRLVDFGGLITRTMKGVGSAGEDATRVCLYVDEYQDVNPAQVLLLKEILRTHPRSTLFAVGDPRQAIYQWRGSDVDRLIHFSDDFPGAEIRTLSENRRSRPGIIHFANAVGDGIFGKAEKSIPAMTVHPERSDGEVAVLGDLTSKNHAEAVASVVERLIGEGVPPSEIAILMRSVVSNGEETMKELQARGIEFFSPNRNAGTDFIESFMDSVIRLIEFMDDEREPQNRQEAEEQEDEIHRRLKDIARFCPDVEESEVHAAIGRWHKALKGIQPAAARSGVTRHQNEDYNFRQQLFDFCNRVHLVLPRDQPELQEGFAAVTQIMKAIEEAYRRRFRDASNARPPPIEVFLGNLRWQLKDQVERWTKTGMTLRREDRVTISTVHAAKGLEWPVVMVPFLWKNKFPVRRSGHGTSFPDSVAKRYGTTTEDERRLWYVAATRARDRLYFFGAADDGHESSEFAYEEVLGVATGTAKTGDRAGPPPEMSKIEPMKRERFYHAGVSDFLLLVECPYQFHLRKMSGIEVPVGEELGAGNIVHRVIERLSSGDKSPDLSQIVEEEVYLPLGEVGHEKRIMKSIEHKMQQLLASRMLEQIDLTEYKFTVPILHLVVTGVVDATIQHGEGVEVVDWKSSVHEQFRQRYANQLVLYAHALRSLGISVGKGTVYDLSAQSTDAALIDVSLSSGKETGLINTAKRAIGDLQTQPVRTWPSSDACSACDLKDICPDAAVHRRVS